MPTAAVIGDSHSCFWRGSDSIGPARCAFTGVKVLHVGPVTAFQSMKLLAQEGVQQFLADGEHEILILAFGEIDCRAHIVKQAVLRNRTLDSVAAEVAARYLETIDAFHREFDLPMIVWAPPASMGVESKLRHHRFPSVGSVFERNYATARYIHHLVDGAEARPWLRVCSLFDLLTHADGSTRSGVLFDGCHVSQTLMPQAQARLAGHARELGIAGAEDWFGTDWDLSETFEEREVSHWAIGVGNSHAKEIVRLGSTLPAAKAVFASEPGEGRRVQIDLSGEYALTRVIVENAPDLCPPESYDCLLSRDNVTYQAAPMDVQSGVAGGGRTTFTPPPGQGLTRFVRFERRDPGVLAFKNLRVYGLSLDRRYPLFGAGADDTGEFGVKPPSS